MAMSVNPAIEGNQPLSSGHCDPAAMIGPRSTVPIRARGHVVPHQQAVHMTATGRTCTRGKTLANRGPSTHDSEALPRKLADLLGDYGEFLQRCDDDRLPRLERLFELAGGGVDVL